MTVIKLMTLWQEMVPSLMSRLLKNNCGHSERRVRTELFASRENRTLNCLQKANAVNFRYLKVEIISNYLYLKINFLVTENLF